MASRNILFANIVVLAIVVCHCQVDLINDVCSKVRNAALCDEALRSDPRSKGADLKGLGEIIFEKSFVAVNVAINVSKTVYNEIKEEYQLCYDTESYAIAYLISSHSGLSEGNWDTVSSNAGTASYFIQTCYNAFRDDGVLQPPQLQLANQNALDLIDVIQEISILGKSLGIL